MESGVWSRWRLGFVLGASLFAGACASAHAQSYETTVADEVVMPAPLVIVPASTPAPRVVIPAPPPASSVASTSTAEAAPQAPFTPRDSPLLTMNDPRPHGSGPAPMDPLLQRRRGRITVRAPLFYNYGYGYGCGAYCAGYGPGYNAYSWYGTPRATWGFGIGAPYYGYGYGRGWGGGGWGYGGGWGRGRGYGHHHHGNHVGVRRIR